MEIARNTERLLWQPGDDPETHPMWEEQLELEYGMMRAGADAFRDRVIVATEKNQMASVKPVQDLMVKWVPGVAEHIKAWCRMWEKKRGVTPAVLPTMQTLDPYMAATVGLRSIFNAIGQQRPTAQNIASEIGRTIEYEQRVRAWEGGSKSDAALYHAFRREQKSNKATSAHIRRASINRFNHYLKENSFQSVSWEAWSADTVFRVGWEVMDAVIRHTGWFQVIDDPEHVHHRGSHKKPMLALIPKEGLTEWLASALDRAEIMQPDFRPTVMPPKRWSTTRDGGYWTPYVRTPRLIRFKVSSEDQREGAADEYDAQEYNKVTRAVNAFQETAYRINAPVLEVFSKVWTELRWSRDKAYLPELNDRELPPRTPRMLAHREANKGKLKEEWTPPDPETEEEIIQWKL